MSLLLIPGMFRICNNMTDSNKFQHIAYTPSLQWYIYFVQKLYKTLKRRIHPLLKMLAKKAWLCLVTGTTPTITGNPPLSPHLPITTSTTITTPTHHYIHHYHHTYPSLHPLLSPHLPIIRSTTVITSTTITRSTTPTHHHTYPSPDPPHLPINTPTHHYIHHYTSPHPPHLHHHIHHTYPSPHPPITTSTIKA